MTLNTNYEQLLKECLNSREVVIFIGAGLSQNLGLPSWKEFAYKHVDLLYDNKKINYKTKELLYKDNYRTVMSLCKDIISKDNQLQEKTAQMYKKLFEVKISNEDRIFNKVGDIDNLDQGKTNVLKEYIRKKEIEKKINDPNNIFHKLYDMNAVYVTTNYDDIFDILAQKSAEDEMKNFFKESKVKELETKVFYLEEEIRENLDNKKIENGQVYHIHGSINKIDDMIVSNEDYILRYWKGKNSFKDFLQFIFDNYNVIFIGYGLEELEILNYMFEGDKAIINKSDRKRVLITDCYENEEKNKIDLLNEYYKSNYNIDICCYDKTKEGYKVLKDIVSIMYDIKKEIDMRNNKFEETIELIGRI